MALSGTIWDYFIVFWSGVLVSFTPCVYPVLPITASVIAGVNTRGSRTMGFFISLVYVFGLALTYCALAVIAALSGKIFGQIQNNPYVFFVVSGVLTYFALVMLDVFPLPNLGMNIQHKVKAKNIGSILLLGMASGLVIGPCTAPVLGTLLLYVASQQNILHAGTLMFVFSYGVGTSLILVGTFSGLMANLPRSGTWLKRVKQLCGLVLMIIAVVYLLKGVQMIF